MNELVLLLLLIIIMSFGLSVIILLCYLCSMYMNYLLDNDDETIEYSNNTNVNV